MSACKIDFYQDLKSYLADMLENKRIQDVRESENKRIYTARNWSDEIGTEIAMYREGMDVDDEGRGRGPSRISNTRGSHTKAALESRRTSGNAVKGH